MPNKPIRLNPEIEALERSVMRDLLALAVDPAIISLAGGLPASELLPLGGFRAALEHVLDRDGPRALQYSPQDSNLRSWIANYMRTRSVPCEAEQIFITNGAQQALTILSRMFLALGDTAAIEEVTFTGIQQVTKGRKAQLLTLPTDLRTGVEVEALEQALQKNIRPRLIILIPEFHNPLGVSMSEEKRRRAASLAEKYEIPLIEDDPYSPLRFAGTPLAPIKAYDRAGMVYYVGSFSKILAPAVRLGWIVAPSSLIPKITILRESIDLESSTLIQRAVAEFLARGELEPHLENMRTVNQARCAALQSALEEHLGDVATWTQPQGGLFLWVTLPRIVDTWRMFQAAVERKVAYIPGSAFSVHDGHRNNLRLNFSNVDEDLIREAVVRLSRVIRAELAVAA